MYVSDYLNADHEVIRKLRAISSLNSFKDEDLKGIIKLSRMIKCEPGEEIIKEGQFDNRIFFLVSGKVSIQKEGEAIDILETRGDLFGEMGFIDGSPRSASIVAIDETICLAFDASYIDRLRGNDRTAFAAILYRIFAEILAERLRTADKKLVEIAEENDRLKAELTAAKGEQNE